MRSCSRSRTGSPKRRSHFPSRLGPSFGSSAPDAVDSGGPVRRSIAFIVALAAWLLAACPTALAGEPPNPHDPCSAAGRDTCGTTGVGFYDTYKYGVRWFGDYRGAVLDERVT